MLVLECAAMCELRVSVPDQGVEKRYDDTLQSCAPVPAASRVVG